MLSADILQLSTYLKSGAFINNIKYRLAINVHNINFNYYIIVNITYINNKLVLYIVNKGT